MQWGRAAWIQSEKLECREKERDAIFLRDSDACRAPLPGDIEKGAMINERKERERGADTDHEARLKGPATDS